MRKGMAVVVLALFLAVVGCTPSLYVTEKQIAPDGTAFWSVVTKTNGHPAVTSAQTFQQVGDAPGKMVADHAGNATGAAVAIPAAALQGTGASLALGLPATLWRPDQVNVSQSGGAISNTNKQSQGQGQSQSQKQKQNQTANGGTGGAGGAGGSVNTGGGNFDGGGGIDGNNNVVNTGTVVNTGSSVIH